LTEGLLAVIREFAPRLPPADVVRLLTILAEAEEPIRRSGNPRLAVEVLLLRWAMAGRTVELSEVIDALDRAPGDEKRGTGAAARSPEATPPLPRPPSPAPAEKGPLSLEHVRASWPRIVADARARAPMLGSLLAEATPVGLEGRVLGVRPANAAHAEGLERQRELIGQLIGVYVAEPPRVQIVTAAASAPERPARLTAESANAERLKALRAKDPTLSAAVDALDLELLE
jgi:hypothetical protein